MRGKKGRKILGFDWDEVNKYKNGEKHRVSFRESEEVFFDKNLKLFYDFHHSQKEKRFVGLGKTNEGRKLFLVLRQLVNEGNTVVVIEHNLDLIKNCDWVIDLGPEGGERGGEIIAQGSPAEIAQNPRSYTGKYLKELLNF
jgi:uncharacterized DUF497 family protein